MSAKKISWMRIAKSVVKTIEKESAKSKARARKSSRKTSDNIGDKQPLVTVSFSNEDGKEYVGGMRHAQRNPKYDAVVKSHLAKLVSFYRTHASIYEVGDNDNPADRLARELFPKADAHTCPYCGVIHEFKAVRARKCPDCGSKLIVRQGRFLKENQVAVFEKAISEFYEKSGLISHLKNYVEQVQSYSSEGNYGRAFLSIADAYQACAIVHNRHYEGGFTAWDYSWQVLNREALEVATLGVKGKADLIGNGYSDVMYARGVHCMKQLKYAETSPSKAKYAKLAISQYLDYLIGLNAVGLTDWQQETAIKHIHIAKALGSVSDLEIKSIADDSLANAPVKPSRAVFETTLREVEEYIFLETDTERLRQHIY